MEKLYAVTTEGDCEGRSVRLLGYYKGEIPKIVTHMLSEGKNPYYGYDFKEITPVEVGKFYVDAGGLEIKHNSYSTRVTINKEKNQQAQDLRIAQSAVRNLNAAQLKALKEHLNA
ncbi:hypothetical protein phiAS5_ORF0239 [Aeromonas phage phiAS5]|uniref:Uncharacterized protein n=1 Tax=Aeromonas phage phiAS5 TaxID=879630 RepID=E1A1Z3_9CAUD|nr:hypothetical protein phiAS5_ORF0239 [Aeromonas phage phiAS5]ADM80082.1 hypothetical protein phiAS5_ORF0239 [Aeromonas phage phiAS5]